MRMILFLALFLAFSSAHSAEKQLSPEILKARQKVISFKGLCQKKCEKKVVLVWKPGPSTPGTTISHHNRVASPSKPVHQRETTKTEWKIVRDPRCGGKK